MSGVINVNVSGRPNNVNIYGTPNKTSRGTTLRAKPNSNVQYHAEHHKGTPEEQKAFKEMHRNWGKEFAKIIANITPEKHDKLQEELEAARELFAMHIFEPNTKKDAYGEKMDSIFKEYFPEDAEVLLTQYTKNKPYKFNIKPLNKELCQKMVNPDVILNYRPHCSKLATHKRWKDNLIEKVAEISRKKFLTVHNKSKELQKFSQTVPENVIDDFINTAPKMAFKVTAMPHLIMSPWNITRLVKRRGMESI